MNARTWRTVSVVLLVVLLAAVPVVRSVVYTVDEREWAVVLQFGEPVSESDEPGLYTKVPLIQEVARLPKTKQFWSGERDVLYDLPTADGKKIEVTPYAVWRITEPAKFLRVLRTTENAESRVKTFVRGAIRDAITSYNLAQVVRSTNRELTYTFATFSPRGQTGRPVAAEEDAVESIAAPEALEEINVGRERIIEEVKKAIQRDLARARESSEENGRGIELVDVGISRIEFVPIVQQAAFERQRAFMQSIAAKYTADGERTKQEILNRTNAEVERITGEGSRQSNTLRGQVEAEIIENYAAAIRETGEFYNFVRTLEAYTEALGGDTRLILTTDSQLLQLLKGLDGLPARDTSGATASPAAGP